MGCCTSKKPSKENEPQPQVSAFDSPAKPDISKQSGNPGLQKRRTFQENAIANKHEPDTPSGDDHELENFQEHDLAGPIRAIGDKSQLLNENSDLVEELKKAIFTNDDNLLLAVLERDPRLARFQFDKDKNVQVIHKASQIENPNLVRYLVEKGADLDCQDLKRWTPLMIAAMTGNLAVVTYLVREGCNMGLESSEGKTAREFAVDALLSEKEKRVQDIKVKKKINDLTQILNLLPAEDDGENQENDDVTPMKPGAQQKYRKASRDNKI